MKVDFSSKEEIKKMIKKETLFLREEEGELWAYRIFKDSCYNQYSVVTFSATKVKKGDTILGSELEAPNAHLEIGNVELVSSETSCGNFAGICSVYNKYRFLKDGYLFLPMWGYKYFNTLKEAKEYCSKK